jgi:hypothetical protein
MEDRLYCRPDPDGTFVITRSLPDEGEPPPPIVARIHDPTYALMMTHSPVLLGTLKWVRTLLDRNACHCQDGVRECVVCVTDDLIAAIEQGTTPPTQE